MSAERGRGRDSKFSANSLYVVWNNIVCLPKVKLYVPVSR